ncbi:MAG: O-antigen ligase family protein [Cyclobacteriaceae bacterium]|nr:O-antigen ligase family protein [Cyclobacteriaceae bacterium]
MTNLFGLRKEKILFVIVFHITIGLVLTITKSIAFYWQVMILILGLMHIVQSGNRKNEAAIWAAYFAGMEVIVRMTGQYAFWEIGKYGVIAFLGTGIFISRSKYEPAYLLYFLFLLPSIFVANYKDWNQAKDMLSFNLSGPLCLTVSAIYFHNRNIDGGILLAIFRAFALPILTMLVYLSFGTVDLSDITFDTHSNFKASGGYGPNQVSMVLGFSVFMLIILRYYRQTFSGWLWIDYILILLLLFRALVTFSRGGVLGMALALGVFLFFNLVQKSRVQKIGKRFLLFVFVGGSAYLLWNYTNELTQNKLTDRYSSTQERKRGDQLTTGRLLLGENDLMIFLEKPLLGIGPGNSKIGNKELIGREVATHTEWTRMLAEHGIFGLISLLLLLGIPLNHLISRSTNLRPLLIALFVLAIFSSTHSAMRVAAIGFLYSLSLIHPIKKLEAET